MHLTTWLWMVAFLRHEDILCSMAMTEMGIVVLHSPVHMLEPGARDPNNMGLSLVTGASKK